MARKFVVERIGVVDDSDMAQKRQGQLEDSSK